MGFLSENVVLTGQGGCLELDCFQWGALAGFLTPEPGKNGQPAPAEEWKLPYLFSQFHDESFPLTFSADQAKAFADAMEFYSAGIPEKEEIGKILNTIDRVIDGDCKKYAITSRIGWVETDDFELFFLESGKEIIRQAVAILRSGRVTVDLAEQMGRPGN